MGHYCPRNTEKPYRPTTCVLANPPKFTVLDAARVGVADHGWPYGPNICGVARNNMVAWALEHGLTLAEPRRPCLHWLVGQVRRCGALRNYYHDGMLWDGDLHQVMDHSTFWKKGKAPFLMLAQPYHLPEAHWGHAMARKWGVYVELAEQAPWYGYDTKAIAVYRSVESAFGRSA